MNDEILEKWKEKTKGLFHLVEYTRFWNYITNLQQENERLNKDNKILKQNNINEVLRNDFDMCVKDLKKANKKIEKLEDYKSRIEKAVEILKNWNQEYNGLMKTNNIYIPEDKPSLFDLRHILNGSDE